MRMLGKFMSVFKIKFKFNHFIFSVQDVTENANWNKCLDVNGMSLARCIYNCEDNGDCENECVAQFKGRTADCPCEVGRIITYTDCSIQFDLIYIFFSSTLKL